MITEFDLYPELRQTQPMEVGRRADAHEDRRRHGPRRRVQDQPSPRRSRGTAMIVTDRLASMFIDENTHEPVGDGRRHQPVPRVAARRRAQAADRRTRRSSRSSAARNSGELPSQLQTNLQVIQGNQSQIQSLSESINRDRDRRLVLEKSIADALAAETPAGVARTPARPPIRRDRRGRGRSISSNRRATSCAALELRLKPEHPDVHRQEAADRRARTQGAAGSA